MIQAAKLSGARRIIAIDLNKNKFTAARAFGATDCVDASTVEGPIQNHIVGMTQWGVDYTFDCALLSIEPDGPACQPGARALTVTDLSHAERQALATLASCALPWSVLIVAGA